MIVHLFPKSQFTREFIEYIYAHFDEVEHSFVLYTNVPFKVDQSLYNYSNVYDYDTKNIVWLYRFLKTSDRIILHNFGVMLRELLLFFVCKSICYKTVWLIWGSDIYCHRVNNMSFTEKKIEIIRGKVMRRFPIVASLTDGDYKLAVDWYGCKGVNLRLDYCEEYTTKLMNSYMEGIGTKDNYIRILVGNSATETNNHEEIIRLLERFIHENIIVYVPLSYGDKNYADKIIELGYNVLGEWFYPITEYMSREDYYRLLASMDIGILNNDRQQGMGNLVALLYYGKKVYMRRDTTMWEEWHDKRGYHINDVKSIYHEEYEQFIMNDIDMSEDNKQLIKEYLNPEVRKKEWDMAFTMPLNRIR